MSNCVFCKIIAGDEPAHVVVDDEVSIAFLDRTPLFPGHVLLVSREHHETLADLPADLVEPMFRRAQTLASVMETTLGAVEVRRRCPHGRCGSTAERRFRGCVGQLKKAWTTSRRATTVMVMRKKR